MCVYHAAPLMAKNKRNYHSPQTVEELTKQNVETIAKLEGAAHAQKKGRDRAADAITRFCGSMGFVWVHILWFGLWISFNTLPHFRHVDQFPFNFLTLIVSLEAIFLSTFILISENRQSRVDERRSHLDLQINLLAEQENTKMLQLLKEIAQKLGIDPARDPHVEVLEQATQPDKLLEQIDEAAAITEEAKKGKA